VFKINKLTTVSLNTELKLNFTLLLDSKNKAQAFKITTTSYLKKNRRTILIFFLQNKRNLPIRI